MLVEVCIGWAVVVIFAALLALPALVVGRDIKIILQLSTRMAGWEVSVEQTISVTVTREAIVFLIPLENLVDGKMNGSCASSSMATLSSGETSCDIFIIQRFP